MTTTQTAPRYIARDTYTGRWARGLSANVFAVAIPARDLAAEAAEGVIWESFGHVNGRERFGRSRYVADSEGNLHVYNSDGGKTLVHPAGRVLRVLRKRAEGAS